MSSEQLLVVSHLAKAYRASNGTRNACIRVLRDVSLAAGSGDLVTVEGARGSGKTTLLLCASGLLRPDLGGVRWPGLAVGAGRPPASIAYVGHRAPMYAFLTVRESLAYAATVRELHAPGTTATEDEPLELADLAPQTATRVGLLTPAAQARFLLALSLVARPRLLLVDDLTAGLDEGAHVCFAQCLSRLVSRGAAVVWAGRPESVSTRSAASYALVDGWLRRAVPSEPRAQPVWTERRNERVIAVAERPRVDSTLDDSAPRV